MTCIHQSGLRTAVAAFPPSPPLPLIPSHTHTQGNCTGPLRWFYTSRTIPHHSPTTTTRESKKGQLFRQPGSPIHPFVIPLVDSDNRLPIIALLTIIARNIVGPSIETWSTTFQFSYQNPSAYVYSILLIRWLLMRLF